MHESFNRTRARVLFVLPHLEAGGVERIVTNLLAHLDRDRFAPGLVLFTRRGSLLAEVPADVAICDLEGRPARRLPFTLARLFGEADLVYAGTNAANLASLAACRLMRRPPPVVISEHTPPAAYLGDAKMRPLRAMLMRWLYPGAAALAVPVPEIGAELCRLLDLPTLPVVAVPNPLVGEAVPASPPIAAAEGDPVFVSAGRLTREKGFDILIEAFARLLRDQPLARLTIFGDGPERAALEDLGRRLGVAARLRMPGFVRDPVVSFGKGAIFVLASRREGFGNVLIEALSAGLPVVAADCPVGPRIILDGGRCGLLVKPHDPEALAQGMRRMATEPSMADAFRRAGPDRAAPFAIGPAVEAHARLFESVARHRSVPA
ncbi:MAG: glycosyltransferase [Alphaproteobacteria bacterium]|nr:glycosyltransferase [Alphaproteobacteria bacterium]